MTPAQEAAVARLSPAKIAALDAALLYNTSGRWRKLAMVIAKMWDHAEHVEGIPDSFYAIRVRSLVERGLLESQGNLDYMRFSEVRRPSTASQ
jgi:hypothetical protein